MWSRRLWVLDLTTNVWSDAYPLKADSTAYSAADWDITNGYCGENMKMYIDKTKRIVYCTPTQNYNQGMTVGINLNNSKLVAPSGPEKIAGSWSAMLMAISQHGQDVWAYWPSQAPYYTSRLWRTNLDSSTVNYDKYIAFPPTITFGNSGEGYGLTYVPEKNKLLYCGYTDQGVKTFWIDPVTETAYVDTTSGNYFPSLNMLVENKIFYVPGIKSVVQINSALDNIRIMRVGNFNIPTAIAQNAATDLNAGKMSVSPNPNNGSLILSISGLNSAAEITIVDVSGKKVFDKSLPIANWVNESVVVSHLQNGIYCATLSTNKGAVCTKKIVVAK